MKRYLIFGGECFYARGGFHDLIGNEQNLADARALIVDRTRADQRALNAIDWWQVIDSYTGDVVAHSEATPLGSEPHNAKPYHRRFFAGKLVQIEGHFSEEDLS